MTPGRLSRRREFTPVPSQCSIFVYMIPPQMSCRRQSPYLVSLATVFWMSRNVSFGGALRDIQETAARETRVTPA